MNTKNFKKQFMYADESRYEAVIADYENALAKINNVIPKIEAFLGLKLSDADKRRVFTKKENLLLDKLRKDYPFPNASDQFNLNAMGLVVDDLANELRTLPDIDFDTQLKGGEFVLSDTTLASARESVSLYTENERQNEAFDFAAQLEAITNKGFSAGLISEYDLPHIGRGLRLLKSGIKDGKRAILINHSAIHELN